MPRHWEIAASQLEGRTLRRAQDRTRSLGSGIRSTNRLSSAMASTGKQFLSARRHQERSIPGQPTTSLPLYSLSRSAHFSSNQSGVLPGLGGRDPSSTSRLFAGFRKYSFAEIRRHPSTRYMPTNNALPG